MHQQLRGGRSHQKIPDYRHREGGKRLLMSLVWLMRGERDTACHSVPLSLFNLVIGWTQTAAQMERQRSKSKKNLLSCRSDSFKRNQRRE